MIHRHKRTSIAILSTITLAMVFLFAFQLLQSDSEAHDMCKSKRAAVQSAERAVTRAAAAVIRAKTRLISARKSLATAEVALRNCEHKHREIHADPG